MLICFECPFDDTSQTAVNGIITVQLNSLNAFRRWYFTFETNQQKFLCMPTEFIL